jgi:Predicted permease
VLTWSLAIGVAVACLWLFSDVLLLLFAATLISCQLRGAAELISERLPISYGLALAIVVLLIGGGVAAISYWRGPALIHELQTVYEQVDQQVSHLWQNFDQADWLQSVLERVKAYLGNKSGALAGNAAGFVTSSIGNLGSLLLIAVAAIYLSVSTDIYERGLVRLLRNPGVPARTPSCKKRQRRSVGGSWDNSWTWSRSAS